MGKKVPKIQQLSEDIIRSYLVSGERYIASTVGFEVNEQIESPITIFHRLPLKMEKMITIGITNKNLIIVRKNPLRPGRNVVRIPLKLRRSAKFTSHFSGDRLKLLWDDGTFDLHLLSQHDKNTQIIAEVFNGNVVRRKAKSNHIHAKDSSPLVSIFEFGGLQTRMIIFGWFIAGVCIWILGAPISKLIYPNGTPSKIISLIAAIGFIVIGVGGVSVIKRREYAGDFLHIKGKYAIVPGILLTLLCWGLAFLFLLPLLTNSVIITFGN